MATEFVGIELELMGADGVRRDLEQLDRLLNSFRGKKKFDLGLSEARAQVVAFKGELEKLRREQSKFEKGSDEWNKYNTKIDEARQKLWNAQQAVREFGQASREAGRTFQQTFNAISSKVAHVGSAMQSFGNAMTQLASPFRRFTSGIVMGAGYKVLNQFTEGIENSFTRADVMRKYPRVMQALGYSAKEAQTSIDKLDASVQGLPTSLDEIVGMSQRFTATVGDLTKGTDLAIAANNAFLASMSTETQRYQGMMQLQDVIGGKKLNAREWYSLANSMMPAIRMMGESLGYEGQQLEDYVAAVQQGKIANKEFLDTLIKAGTADNGKIRKIAMESLDTWEAFFSRIRTAASRLGFKGIIEPLNSLVETVTGGKFKSVNLLLDDFIINRIDKMQSSVKKWIEAHPEQITNFFKELKGIKLGNFFKGYAEGLGLMVKATEKLVTAAGEHPKLIGWLGGFFGVGGTLGRMSTILGGLLKGTRHIWALIGTGGSWLIKGKLGKLGIFGKLASIFGSKKSIEAAKGAAQGIPTVANTFRSAFKSLEGLIKVGGAITIASGTAWFATESVKGVLNDLKDIGNIIGSGDIDWASAGKAMAGFAGYLASFMSVAYVMSDISSLAGSTAGLGMIKSSAILGGITAIAAGIADLDMFFIKDTFKKFKEVTDYLTESIDNLRNLKKINTDKVKERVSNVIDALQQVYASLKVQDEEGKSLMAASTQEINAMKDIIGGMKTMLDDILPINETMRELSKADLIDTKSAQEVGEKISGILESLNEAFVTFLSGDYGSNPADISLDMANTIGNFNTALTSLAGENGLFNTMRRVLSQTRDIPGVQSIGSVMSSIKRFLTDEGGFFGGMKEIVKSANDMGDATAVESKMANFQKAFESIRVIFTKLKAIKKAAGKWKTGDLPGMGAVKNLVSQLQVAFEPRKIGEINSQIESFLTQVNGLLDAVKKINVKDGKIEIEIKLSDKIVGLNTVISDINGIDSKIKAAINSIKTYYEKTVTVSINAKAVTNGVISGMGTVMDTLEKGVNGATGGGSSSGFGGGKGGKNIPVNEAKGGLIYRAEGGGVSWRRKGTDTVPAMLTPGEYVHNRRAVSMFGIDFMRKVNNLDMKGAMNELMHRAGNIANVNRGTNITNNNYNNQRVVINNSNAGAGYTFQTASRFVGAF